MSRGRISRRDFIKYSSSGILVSTFGGLSNSIGSPFKEINENQIYDVIILGAGASGLAASYVLQDHPELSVLIIEGSNRIGGRVYTNRDSFSDPVELGAEFIHRSPGNAQIWTAINQFKFQTLQIPKVKHSLMYNANWKDQKPKSIVGAAMAWSPFKASSILDKINNSKNSDVSAYDWLESQNFKDETGKDFVELSLNGYLPAPLKELSMRGYAQDNFQDLMEEKNEYFLTGGYDQLFTKILENQNIVFKQKVNRIDYKKDHVVINIENGKTFKAKTAICTFSIGMLKSGKVEFVPELPYLKQEALKCIKTSGHSKYVIEFEKSFWPEKMGMLHRTDNLRNAGKTYFQLNYGNKDKSPRLAALILGEDDSKLRSKSLEDAIDLICKDLDEVFKLETSIKNLIARKQNGELKVARKEWINDPFSLGGTSYLSTEDTEIDVTKARSYLADDYQTRPLFWAGEATATKAEPSSVHGAFQTGLDAAIKIINYLKIG